MAGSVKGGKQAAATNKAKWGEDFYKEVGALGGKADKGNRKLKGFGTRRELASIAGRKGGLISRRGKKKK